MNSKIFWLIDEYDLSGMGERLVEYWTRKDDGYSLRDLADYFNHELLRAAMESADMTTLDSEVENTYRLLTVEDVSTGVRTQAETTLERNGIDPRQLQQDFVSHQAIHTYLTKYRALSTCPSGPNRIASRRLKTRSSGSVVASSPSPKSASDRCAIPGRSRSARLA